MKNKNPFDEYQNESIQRRVKRIRGILAVAIHADFETFNKLATYLAARLTEIEQREYDEMYSDLHTTHPEIEYKLPREVSRQIFYRNEEYKVLCDAFLARKRLVGSKSIKKPSDEKQAEILLKEKDIEISNLREKVKRLEALISKSTRYYESEFDESNSNSLEKELMNIQKEKSMTVQALIKLIGWGKKLSLLDYKNGQVIDIAFEKTVVEKKYLSHCERSLNSGLKDPL